MSNSRSFVAALAVLFLAAPLAAQGVTADFAAQPSVTTSAPVAVQSADAAASAPMMSAASVGVRKAPADTKTPFAAPLTHSQGTAMMIVGGAALLVGAVVGGDAGSIIMISGGVVGLIGLWNYLR